MHDGVSVHYVVCSNGANGSRDWRMPAEELSALRYGEQRAAAAILGVIFMALRGTRLGLIARGTMENPNMAAALGVSPPRVYATTFGVGAALTGLAGGLLAPISGVLPTVGAAYVAKAFITVISGGTAILAGTAAAASLFGSVNQLLTYFTTPVIGEAGLLAAAILLLRVLPHGITGKLFKGSL